MFFLITLPLNPINHGLILKLDSLGFLIFSLRHYTTSSGLYYGIFVLKPVPIPDILLNKTKGIIGT